MLVYRYPMWRLVLNTNLQLFGCPRQNPTNLLSNQPYLDGKRAVFCQVGVSTQEADNDHCLEVLLTKELAIVVIYVIHPV